MRDVYRGTSLIFAEVVLKLPYDTFFFERICHGSVARHKYPVEMQSRRQCTFNEWEVLVLVFR